MSKPPIFRWLLPVAACALVLGLYGWMADGTRAFAPRPNPAEHNYNLLVQGFQAGQLSLKLAVPPGLTKLADPYDPAANIEYRSPRYSLHDLSYFRGRLFLYSGVSPALLVFWPWAALTGRYLSHQSATALFCAVEFLVGAGLLLGLRRRYFPEASAGVAAAGILTLGLAAGTPILLQAADVLEVPVACGCALTMLALAGVWLALEQPARRVWWLAAASLAYGLAIGARPSVLFGAIILLVPVALAWREPTEAGAPRRAWALLAAAVIPLALCGIALLAYNDLRFGRPFEFGQRYQLAGVRQDSAQKFSLGYLWFNFRVYFLDPARWSGSFPFVRDIAGPPLPPGHAPGENVFGVMTTLPVLWLAFAAPLAWRGRAGPVRIALGAFVVSAALLFATSALVLCLYFGTTWRYEVEFLPPLALLSVIGIFSLERALAGRPAWRAASRAAWALLLAYSVAFNLLESVSRHAVQIEFAAENSMDAGRVPEALDRFERALRLDPGDASAHNYFANALATIPGRLPDAIAHYEQALRIEPNFAEAHNNIATAYARMGRFDQAVNHYELALKLDPGLTEARDNLNYLRSLQR